MDTCQTRAYREADAPAVAALLNLVDEHAGGHGGHLPDEIGALISTLVPDLATDTRVVFDRDVDQGEVSGTGGELVAVAMAAPPPAGGYRVDLLGGVHPRWRGRGIGRELIAWQLGKVEEFHRRSAPEAVWEFHIGAALGDEDTARLVRRFALTPVRYWLDMAASTVTAPAVELPAGVSVSTYAPELEKDVHATHTEAFVDHWGYQQRDLDSWARLSVRSGDFRPDLSLVAHDGAQLVGYVLSYADADPLRTYIGQVGVRRQWRRRGVAAALLARVLAAAAEAGLTSAALGVDADSPTGAVGVYERVGFAVESRGVTYSRPLPPVDLSIDRQSS